MLHCALRLPLQRILSLLAGLTLVSGHAAVQSPPPAQLRCEVSYAGTTHTVLATPVADPYPVQSVDIGGRFRFKAVMVGQGAQVQYIKLYSYLDTRRQPVLAHQARYLPPYPHPTGDQDAVELTGMQTLYAGTVEREMQYHCTLQGAQP